MTSYRVTKCVDSATDASNSCKHYESKGPLLICKKKDKDTGDVTTGYKQVCCQDYLYPTVDYYTPFWYGYNHYYPRRRSGSRRRSPRSGRRRRGW